MTYQENDVIEYGDWNPLSDAIVDKVGKDGAIHIKAFRHWTNGWGGKWYSSASRLDHKRFNKTIRPHPRADKVWAEYCAWRMLQCPG
jgi:hypothetical protein